MTQAIETHTRYWVYSAQKNGLRFKETVCSEMQAATLVAQGYYAIDSATMMPVKAYVNATTKKKGR